MYVAIRTGQGGKYLYVQTSVFVNGKSSVITVLKLGRLDKYIEENGENAVMLKLFHFVTVLLCDLVIKKEL